MNKLKNDFNDYLADVFTREHPMIMDDDLPDAFNDYEWDTEELIKHGNEFGAKLADQVIEEAEKLHKSSSHSNSDDITPYLKTKYLK